MLVQLLLALFAAILVSATVASMTHSSRWYLRMWDFPRVAILLFALAVLAAALLLAEGALRWATVLAMLAVAGWQARRIAPYTRLARTEAARVPEADDGHQFSALAFNVLQTNRNYSRTLAMIEAHDPDIVLLLETDSKWAEALAPVIARYPHQALEPLDNLYGLIFLTRLAVDDCAVRYLVEDDIPSVTAVLRTRGGERFRYLGLHPRPPQPGNDTDERDAEIAVAAREAARDRLPVLAMGDFNDVAWSRTSQLFKRIGGYLDPRIGRGFFATFPAALPILRWPLDHLFISPEFTFAAMRVLPSSGSDHLPVLARLCLRPRLAAVVNAQPDAATAEDQADARAMIAAVQDGPASA